jgi:hypothetical protein
MADAHVDAGRATSAAAHEIDAAAAAVDPPPATGAHVGASHAAVTPADAREIDAATATMDPRPVTHAHVGAALAVSCAARGGHHRLIDPRIVARSGASLFSAAVIASADQEGSMAFLKETERSLRAYFIVVGVIGTLIALGGLSGASKLPLSGASALLAFSVWFPPLARLVLGPAFVITGIGLKHALENGAPRARLLVKAAAAVYVLEAVLFAAMASSIGGRDTSYLAGQAFGRAVIPLVILWYIHASLKRLAQESHQRVVETVGRKFE